MIDALNVSALWSNPGLIDFVVIGVMLLAFLLGLITGFIWQVAGMISIGLGLLAAWFFTTPVADLFGHFTNSKITATVSARIALFCGVALLIRLLATLLKTILEKMKLGQYDRLLGGFISMAKALIFCTVMLGILSQVPGNLRGNVEVSVIGGVSTAVADWISGNAKAVSPQSALEEAINKIISRASSGKSSQAHHE